MDEAQSSTLFEPYTLRGGRTLNNRVVMAPMTRSRASEPGDVPSPAAALYYAQRASAGLIVTEATNISLSAKGYSQTPGIYDEAQQQRWAEVTSAVHEAVSGSTIFMQLWHVGRLSAQEVSGSQPVAPSALQAPTTVWVKRANGWTGMVQCDPPRALHTDEIPGVVDMFTSAAKRAIEAGADGVELHGANGYLIDQFMRGTTNRRTDEYGGSISNRLRFLREVVSSVADAVGPQRLGIRLSPVVGIEDAKDPEIFDTTLQAAKWLDEQQLAYLHLAESDVSWLDAGPLTDRFRADLRAAFSGPIIVAANYDRVRAEAIIDNGFADLVAFGRPFIANPDLVSRLASAAALAESNPATWYGGDHQGYTDYPTAAVSTTR
ncbi:alkene reductase [Mycolicibacterium sp. CBM1]